MRNAFTEIMRMLGPGSVQIGKVTAYADGTATVQLIRALRSEPVARRP